MSYPTITAPKRIWKAEGETRNVAVAFGGVLDSGELLTGTPTITADSTAVTLSNKQVSTAALTVDGSTYSIGQVLQFTIAGGTTSSTPVTITMTVTTDSTLANQTVMGRVVCDIIP